MLIFIDANEALLVNLGLCVFEAESATVGAASDRNQHSIECLTRLHALSLQRRHDAFRSGFEL